jgi:sulfite reductase (ferredoxin)
MKAVGIGDGNVVIDLVTFNLEAKDKLTFAQEAFEDKVGCCYLLMRIL